jgi:hypothetical protein
LTYTTDNSERYRQKQGNSHERKTDSLQRGPVFFVAQRGAGVTGAGCQGDAQYGCYLPRLSLLSFGVESRLGVVEVGEGDNAYKADAKKKALEAYAELGVISHACKAAGIARCTWYDWVENDPDFAQAAKEAEEAAIDALEAEARARAKKGSDILLMFCMKAKRPEYRDRQTVDLNATGEIAVKFVPAQTGEK